MSTVIDLAKLRNPTVGWKPIGKVPSSELVWPHYAPWPLGSGEVAPLKMGTNVIAVYSNVEYDEKTEIPFGQVGCFIEGLKTSDLQ